MSNNFLRGMKTINLFPNERKFIVSLPSHSNEDAFRKDLEQVGADMHFAMKSIEQPKDSCKKTDDLAKENGHSAQS